jgi:hypothetical protein
MQMRTHFAIALFLVALGLAPGAAHLMEMPVKLSYEPGLYAQVTSSLYAFYGVAAGVVQVAAVVAVSALAVRLRRSPQAGMATASAAALLISLALWGAVVAPVNAAWAEVSRADHAAFAAAYAGRRLQWEYGHLAAFIAWFTGWSALVRVATRRIT